MPPTKLAEGSKWACFAASMKTRINDGGRPILGNVPMRDTGVCPALTCMYVYIYIYTVEMCVRENVCVCVLVFLYIIYIYRERERERERERATPKQDTFHFSQAPTTLG